MTIEISKLTKMLTSKKHLLGEVEKDAVVFRIQDGSVPQPTLNTLGEIRAEVRLLQDLIQEADPPQKK